MDNISKIRVGSTSYNIKDAAARTDISNLQGAIASLQGGQYFLGVTTTAMTDGKTGTGAAVVSIDGNDVTAVNGNVVIYGNKEFIFDGTTWYEFGDLSTIGDLGYKDNASASYTPAGSNQASAVTFSGQTDSNFVTGYNSDGVAPSKAADTFSAGTLPSKAADTFSAGSLPSLGTASTGNFNTDASKAAMGTGDDAETLIIEAASTSSAVTAQGTFSAGSLPSFTEGTFTQGTLPSFTEGAFSAGSVPTLATAKAITAVGTGTAAAQTFTGSAATITVS